jgi:hypothetical protein
VTKVSNHCGITAYIRGILGRGEAPGVLPGAVLHHQYITQKPKVSFIPSYLVGEFCELRLYQVLGSWTSGLRGSKKLAKKICNKYCN